MNVPHDPAGAVPRRTMAKGVAWATPTVVLGAGAPALAGSVPPPPCPTCLKAGNGGLFTAQWVGVLGLAVLTGTSVFNIDSSGCSLSLFQPSYTVVGLGGSLTWSDGSTSALNVSLTGGGGTIGTLSAVSSSFVTTNQVALPNGSGFLGAYKNSQKRPTKICYNFNMFFMAIGAIPLPACCYTLCYALSTNATGAVVVGTGTVNFSATESGGTIAPC